MKNKKKITKKSRNTGVSKTKVRFTTQKKSSKKKSKTSKKALKKSVTKATKAKSTKAKTLKTRKKVSKKATKPVKRRKKPISKDRVKAFERMIRFYDSSVKRIQDLLKTHFKDRAEAISLFKKNKFVHLWGSNRHNVDIFQFEDNLNTYYVFIAWDSKLVKVMYLVDDFCYGINVDNGMSKSYID